MVAFDTILPADSVEFCPHPSARDILVCGTYKLLDSSGQTQQRRGECIVLQLDASDSAADRTFHKIQSFTLPAILDLKWCHSSPSTSGPVLGIADSEANVRLYVWEGVEKSFQHLQSIQCASGDALCLTIDWSNRRTERSHLGSMVVSLSNGSLCVVSPVDGSHFALTNSWHAHDYEPWAAAWDYWNANILLSGGDDLKMKSWDIRQGFSRPTFINKHFEAGVTSIQSHPHMEHTIAVGSYDNTVRLFDNRKPLVPLAETDVGGGAWRVKWHPLPTRKDDLLVACMHDGAKIVRFDFNDGNHTQLVKRFDAHESMVYGADWSFESLPGAETTVASCSFYDHACYLWSG